MLKCAIERFLPFSKGFEPSIEMDLRELLISGTVLKLKMVFWAFS
jgi:hypothetical protein